MSNYWLYIKDVRELSHYYGECIGNYMAVNKDLPYIVMQYAILHEFHHARYHAGKKLPTWKKELGAQFWATLGCPIGSLLAKIMWLGRKIKGK